MPRTAIRRSSRPSDVLSDVAGQLLDRSGPGAGRRPDEAVRAGEGQEAAPPGARAQLAGPGLGAEPVRVAVEDEDGLLDLLDRLLEAVGEVNLEGVPDPAKPGALPVGGVRLVEVGRLELVVPAPGEQDLADAAEARSTVGEARTCALTATRSTSSPTRTS